MTFPDILKSLRENEGLLQNELANKLGMPRGTYNNYELGRREPSLEVLNKIADFFNVTVDYLLGRTSQINGVIKKDIKLNLKQQLLEAGIKDVVLAKEYEDYDFNEDDIKTIIEMYKLMQKNKALKAQKS